MATQGQADAGGRDADQLPANDPRRQCRLIESKAAEIGYDIRPGEQSGGLTAFGAFSMALMERDDARAESQRLAAENATLRAERDSLAARLGELAEACRPFAEYAGRIATLPDSTGIGSIFAGGEYVPEPTLGDCRKLASLALPAGGEGRGG